MASEPTHPMAWLSAWANGDHLDLAPFDEDSDGDPVSAADEPLSRQLTARLTQGLQRARFAVPPLSDHLPPA